jgi:hypothetical protein
MSAGTPTGGHAITHTPIAVPSAMPNTGAPPRLPLMAALFLYAYTESPWLVGYYRTREALEAAAATE